jgi:hypothetical protein
MDLPALQPAFSRAARLTVELLRAAPLADALGRGLADLAGQYGPEVGDRVYVRVPIGDSWLEGWYSPGERELEPIGWGDPATALS